MSAFNPMPGDKEDNRRSSDRKQIDIKLFGRRVLIIQDCLDFSYDMDPSMIETQKLKQTEK